MRHVLLLLTGAALIYAQPASNKGRELVTQSLAALGGEKFLAMKDRIEDGRAYSFYHQRLSGLARAKIYTRYLEGDPGPGKLAQREREAFGKDEDYGYLFLEDKGYEVTFRGARPVPDERWQRYLESTRRNYLYILRNRLKEPGLVFDYRGSSVWQNTPVEAVDITDADNNVVTVYLQATTKLPVRQVYVRRDPKTKERNEFTTIFSKFRDVGDGVQWPFNMLTERNGEKVFEIFSDSVTINQDLNDDLFLLGSRTKVLPPAK